MDFVEWKAELDSIFMDFYGLESDDFEDYLWYDAFKAGDSPSQAFMDWRIENA